jgi:hypothetical protein
VQACIEIMEDFLITAEFCQRPIWDPAMIYINVLHFSGQSGRKLLKKHERMVVSLQVC